MVHRAGFLLLVVMNHFLQSEFLSRGPHQSAELVLETPSCLLLFNCFGVDGRPSRSTCVLVQRLRPTAATAF